MTALFERSEDQMKAWTDAQKAMSFPVGATSPLWLMFAGAASAGVAYWWLSRWRTVTNLEAILVPAAPSPEPALIVPEVVAPAVVETFEAVTEAVQEPAIEAAPEAIVEAVAEPTVEIEPEPAVEPGTTLAVASETPLEAKPAPKPKSKAAAVRAAPRTTSGPTRRS